MGRNILDLPLLILGLIGFGLSGWWAIYAGPNAADKLEANIYAAIMEKKEFVELDWLHIRPDGQHVILIGTAPTEDLQNFAEAFVLDAAGGAVTQVINQTTLADPVDAFIWTAVKAEKIMLSGHVPSVAARTQLNEQAQELGELESDLSLANGAPDENWLSVATSLLDVIGTLQQGNIEMIGHQVMLTGVAPNLKIMNEANAALSGLPAPYQIDARIDPPDLWTARIERDRIVFGGRIPSEATRREILALTERFYDGEIVDEAVLDEKIVPTVMNGLRLAWPRFLQFSNGNFAFNRDGFRLEGLAPSGLIEQLTLDVARLPEGQTFDLKAQPIETALDELEGINFAAGLEYACNDGFEAVLLKNPMAFSPGGDELTAESMKNLDKVLLVFELCPELTFEIGGHTDNEGRLATNLDLSERRAEAVAAYLIDNGVDEGRLTVTGYGPKLPIASNETEDGRASNRRIEIRSVSEGEM